MTRTGTHGTAGRPRRITMAVIALAVGASSAWAVTSSSAASTVPGRLPSADPLDTPAIVQDGRIDAIVATGGRIVIGGTFTSLTDSPANGGGNRPRTRLAAIEADTGAVIRTFLPAIDGDVTSIAVAPDGGSVYIGGLFTRVGGVPRAGLARVRLSDGALMPAFAPPAIGGPVYDVHLVGGAVWVGGQFSSVGGTARSMLAAFDPTTGALLAQPALAFTGTHNGGVTKVVKFAPTPDGSRVVVLGNFTAVGGLPRHQIAVLDVTASPVAVSPWRTDFYSSDCAMVFNSTVRDLDIASDGTYAVVSSTGSWRPPPSSCDTIARFELTNEVAGIRPTWASYTGGDTTHAVEIAGPAVYIGGHMRWVNNPLGNNEAGPGAVPREGIAALDVANGLPLSWNPGRSRGQGVFDLLVTADGLWAGSDTATWAGEARGRLAMFPFASGTVVPRDAVHDLPGAVYLLARPAGSADVNAVRRRSYTGAGAPGAEVAVASSLPWSLTRGAFAIGSTLFTFRSDGALLRRSFDGTTFGATTVIPTFGNSVTDDVPDMTGAAYDAADGRIYYTLAGSNQLFWRAFTPESGAIGAQRFVATGDVASLAPWRVAGMFRSGVWLYFADRNTGALSRIRMVRGVVTGPVVRRDATADWRARAMFVLG